ncbi:MAG: AmmeMemoRadiSam system radical SAM enzyme [Lachnospiraceae bacterium]|nr:AmmeMemoRadiSam system radical SAM enzyme [Lachnospiraceae bacterium]
MCKKAVCPVCFHHCELAEGQRGFCEARIARDGKVEAENYGRVTSLALDPIEKKPLYLFHPGSKILSTGSYGCNLKCNFCQNHEISQSEGELFYRQYSPEELVGVARELAENQGNIGIAFTYNEPLVGYEFVLETAKRIKEAGLYTVLVTNGTAEEWVFEKLIPYVDAMNIDLKAFSKKGYENLGGDFETVKNRIKQAQEHCHVELTSLIVPGLNDAMEEMELEVVWIADLNPEIPLHITRFFPRYRKLDAQPTDIRRMETLKKVAERHLKHVFLGNV